MSSILKALKKVEKEKGAREGSKSPVARQILSEIIRSEGRPGTRSRLPLIFLVLLGAGVLGGVLLMQNDEPPPVQTAQPMAEMTPVVAPEAPAESTVVAADGAEPLIAPATEAPVELPPSTADAGPDPLKVAEEVVQTTRDATAALRDTATTLRDTADALKNKVIVSTQDAIKVPAVVEKKSITGLSRQAPLTPVAVASSRPASVSVSGPDATSVPVSVASRTPGWHLSHSGKLPVPELNISEIHWRPVAKERLAVVNDLPVLEGDDIEGARVDRIFKDRIRFIVNGRYLEVKVSSEPAP